MICATCLSWLARPLLGKTVAMVGRATRASASALLSASEFVVVVLAAWIRETPVSNVRRFCSADIRLWDSAELLKPESNFVGSPLDWMARAVNPWQKILFPASEMSMVKFQR